MVLDNPARSRAQNGIITRKKNGLDQCVMPKGDVTGLAMGVA